MTVPGAAATDAFGRRFRYLRLSVTEVCNFRCTYCLPNGFQKAGSMDFLSTDEIGRLVCAFSGLGIGKVRLTGGEPTVRKDIGGLIARVAAQPGIDKVALTTNGWNLSRHIDNWVASGLTHLNVSVDALERETFRKITGHDRLEDVLAGLERAQTLPLKAVKINAVLLRDALNTDFSAWTEFVRYRPIAIRFIELMRTGDNRAFFEDQHVSGQILGRWLEERNWTPRPRGRDDGPAIEYCHPGHAGRIGIIAPYAPGFCNGCNRLRVTARGQLRLCLFGQGGRDLRDLLASDEQRSALQQRVADALAFKPASHALHAADPGDIMNLAQTGG
ncbi:MAG: GTP 3',8-cyclase MoaA [Parvibaculum sp.]|uniref:GTP 3',8-cyclase MoaA n=1 Tax=Parvibaculum sp. TaxID=2024848 RepID=UPI001D404A55|nr:GTP 3',8-cyclase MoaA [Parvibaculum sp.]MBX3489923.1 GTP 3',8-cyclase MoaA [Parvibaculum sp.]MBX3494966.1 GTP 3',8-cyclase MoaA [Parvibaculum sp.]MCW5726089.1 GTP 3',8-cyclase MoaA [Parvibaculum sp.]